MQAQLQALRAEAAAAPSGSAARLSAPSKLPPIAPQPRPERAPPKVGDALRRLQPAAPAGEAALPPGVRPVVHWGTDRAKFRPITAPALPSGGGPTLPWGPMRDATGPGAAPPCGPGGGSDAPEAALPGGPLGAPSRPEAEHLSIAASALAASAFARGRALQAARRRALASREPSGAGEHLRPKYDPSLFPAEDMAAAPADAVAELAAAGPFAGSGSGLGSQEARRGPPLALVIDHALRPESAGARLPPTKLGFWGYHSQAWEEALLLLAWVRSPTQAPVCVPI